MPKDKEIPRYNSAEFSEAVLKYVEGKDNEKALKSRLETLNNGIKLYMSTNAMQTASANDIEITLRETETVKYNEIMLLQYLKEKGFTNCVKTKEYVDMNELERHIYAGAIDSADLDKFKDREYKQALYYKRLKNEGK